MAQSGLEVADIFRDHGSAWREANRRHVSLEQMKVMSAIERCRTAALGGHVARCENLRDLAYHNKRVIYDLLIKAAADTTLTIAADPKRLGARIGITAVLHTWGSAMTHHPHVHMIVPGGGISLDHTRWVSCRPGFFLPVRVLSRLFRRLFLGQLLAAHQAGRLAFFGDHAALAEPRAFAAFVAPLHKTEW